ncbi:ABC transporter substrate-binding protein [Actinomadura violacea]|uniref:ABC transporter substrate-binding protein n=1 Tax=Actinomadura violacea TaxID=2819934 RepID=A0ABS3RIF1_9ACTN|nr:ABC transporter substrate-binding protein [Actinomadura violacea]MBO2456508.1 ABC transporter substrate-binding protein [Actinomadura violacea]
MVRTVRRALRSVFLRLREPDPDDPIPLPRYGPRPWFVTVAAMTALAVVAAGVWYVFFRPPTCGHGVDRIGGECIGVTDGAVHFDPSMKKVDEAIRKENKRVTGLKGGYVTVAFLGALSTTKEHDLTGGRVTREIEGAHIAQMRANRGAADGDKPGIKLVLANEGADQSHWKKVVGRLERMRDAEHLVAVVGMGISTRQTIESARELSAKKIGMVGDVVTGDGFDSAGAALGPPGTGGATRIDGLTRVAVPVRRQVEVLAGYLKPRIKSAVMVVDRKSDDLYSKSLERDFHDLFKDAIKTGGRLPESFSADSPAQPGLPNVFAAVASNLNLCGGDPPDVVLYAGRTIFLPRLLQDFEKCEKHPITVVTGSDAEGIADFPGDAPATVVYTPLTDPDLVAGDSSDPQQQKAFATFLTEAERYYEPFDRSQLRDAWEMMAHDAFLTAAQAVHLARGGEIPSSADVLNFLYNLHETNYVQGAAGRIEMDPDGDPHHPTINVVELRHDGTRKLLYPARGKASSRS